jgi:hypothetical protein
LQFFSSQSFCKKVLKRLLFNVEERILLLHRDCENVVLFAIIGALRGFELFIIPSVNLYAAFALNRYQTLHTRNKTLFCVKLIFVDCLDTNCSKRTPIKLHSAAQCLSVPTRAHFPLFDFIVHYNIRERRHPSISGKYFVDKGKTSSNDVDSLSKVDPN